MSKLPPDDDMALFRAETKGISRLTQDKIPPTPPRIKGATGGVRARAHSPRAARPASFEFSDAFEGYYQHEGPVKYVQPGTDSFAVKRLRRGDYPPDLILDLHGLTQQQSKAEIAALIDAAQKEQCACVCIVHGIGGQVLKRAVPNYLVQHPDVLAFHQAPLEWGGNGALLVLLRLP